MKQTILIIIAILFSNLIYAQTADWLWAQHAGGTGYVYGRGIATDSSGNSYVTGYFRDTAAFGMTSPLNNGYFGVGIFITKLDPSGNFLWAQQASVTSYGAGHGISIDSSGNSYVTGYFAGTATFGNTTLTSNGIEDIFVAKLDSSGNFLWAQQAGGIYNDYGNEISTDSSGNSYVTGSFYNTATFGTISLENNSTTYSDIFIAKLDTNGNFLWAQQAGGIYNDFGHAISTDSSGNSYVTGYFDGTATFGTSSLENNSTTYSDIFITKLDTNGNFLWAQQAGGTGDDYGYGISTDSSGNSYVTGSFFGAATFGTTSLINNGLYGNDIFITKLDTNGNFLWAQQAGGTYDDCGYGISTDSVGNSYVTGSFYNTATFGTISFENNSTTYSNIFITKLDSAGNFLWAQQAGSTYFDYGFGIATDNSGNSYVTGDFHDTATFGTTILTSSGGSDIFIAKLSSDGVFVSDELIAPAASVSHLGNAYPNPFRAGSCGTIKADVPAQETGVFTVYNLRGQVLQSHSLSSGAHEINVSATDLAPGIYFYRLKTPSLCEVKKLLVLK